MRRSPIERLMARWVTGPYGHGAAFALDLAGLLPLYVRWRRQQRAQTDAEDR